MAAGHVFTFDYFLGCTYVRGFDSFQLFCRCAKCDELSSVWDELAENVLGGIAIAKVDCSVEPQLSRGKDSDILVTKN